MKKNKLQKNKGFSMVEFIVIISIFAIMTSVSMLNYNDHHKAIEQANLTQNIALTIRQAQVYGISASAKNIGDETFEDEDVAETFFANDTGILDITRNKSIRGTSLNLDTNEIVLFEDNTYPSNFIYNTGSDRVIDERKIVSPIVGFEYAYLCDNANCVKKDSGVVDITFQRPYPDAIINYRDSIGTSPGSFYDKVSLVVSKEDGADKNSYIDVQSIGNITVKLNHVI